MLGMPNGQTVATAVIGREGSRRHAIGAGAFPRSRYGGRTRGGIASRIAALRFHAAFNQSDAIRHAVQTHARALLMQFQHVAACNALHPVEARMARWLLHIHDRIDGNVIPLTQETLSQLLGVRRTTVTLVVRKLGRRVLCDPIGGACSRLTGRGSKKPHANL